MHTFCYGRPEQIQGDFYHWYPPISVPKRKLPSSQSRPFLVTGFPGTAETTSEKCCLSKSFQAFSSLGAVSIIVADHSKLISLISIISVA